MTSHGEPHAVVQCIVPSEVRGALSLEIRPSMENKKPLGRSTGQTIGCPTSALTQTPDTPTLDAHFNGVGDMAAELVR